MEKEKSDAALARIFDYLPFPLYPIGSTNASSADAASRFWHKPVFDALEVLKGLCEQHGTTLVSASLRWLHHHSVLSGDDGDAVIVCGSTVDQVKANVDACADDTPLPQELVDAFEVAWGASKPYCPKYFR